MSNIDVKLKFEGLLINCISVKGCVAFWTIGSNYFNNLALVKALKKENSYYCVDIQEPTSIDKIAEHVKLGVEEIYLHKYRLDPSQYNLTTNLLHSKVALFELKNNEIEIWIGSHNLTHYALSGINLEATSIIRCTKNDKIYYETLGYLDFVKNVYCNKFDIEKVEIYKKLQSRNAEKDFQLNNGITSVQNTVELVGLNMEYLEHDRVIQLLSLNRQGYSKFKVVGETIYVHTYDIATKKGSLYLCKISQSGEIDPKNPKLHIIFSEPRRFAYIGTEKLSYLKPPIRVDDSVLEVSKFFVNLTIYYKIEDFEVFEKPPLEEMSLWKQDRNSPYKDRVREKEAEKCIQVATYDMTIKPISVKIGFDWKSNEQELNQFYTKIEEMIKQEHYLSKNTAKMEIKRDFEDLIKECDKHLNLPRYLKSNNERIIWENKK